jgi:hypothetical protein
MAGYYSIWRFSRTTLAILLATACSAQVALGQYTFVQDSDSVGDWSDLLNWDTDNDPGTPNTSYPNGIGVTAQINQPIKSGVGQYTLEMPATEVTLGRLTIDNTGYDYSTPIIIDNNGARLIFEDSSGTAKFIGTANPTTAPGGVQDTIHVPVLVKNILEITQENYANLNTGTIFTGRFDGDINSKIIKKGIGGIQFNYNVAPPLPTGQGFLGQIEIQEGVIRLINRTTFLSTVSGITVSNNGQLQLADNNALAVPDYMMASGAVLNLNGVGSNGPTAGFQGALRIGIASGRTTTFHNPVVLQSDSVISVGGANTVGVINQAVTGPGGLTKQGDGKLSLTSAGVAYGGDTHILTAPTASAVSVLSLSNPVLPDTKDLYLSATRTALELNLSGLTDTIRSFYVDGLAQPSGLYGPIGSANTNDTELAMITGDGYLNVTSLPGVGVPGDFNNNGVVDGADYVLWRKGGPLQNEVDTPGTVNAQDYLDWRARFGNTMGSGSSLGAAAVPEPSTVMLLVFIASLFVSGKLGRHRS